MSHEYDQSRTGSVVTGFATTHSHTIEPGQSSRSAFLRKPEHAITSGLVQRKAHDVSNSGTRGHIEQLTGQDAFGGMQRHEGIAAVQLRAQDEPGPDDVHRLAIGGLSGSTLPLPFLEQIQRSFGTHDVSAIQAHIGGPSVRACDGMGAKAYATGTHVVFREAPDLHTAAHEAAHVVQQRTGVQLSGGVGQVGDKYERNADEVADAVVAGRSAEDLLNTTHQSNQITEPSSGTGRPGAFQALQEPSCPTCGGGNCKCSKVSGTPEIQRSTVHDRVQAIEAPSTRPPSAVQAKISVSEPGTVQRAGDKDKKDAPPPWTIDDLKQMLTACDGNLGLYAKAKKANKGKDPTIILGTGGWTDMSTGTISIDKTLDKCNAVQQLLQELSNLARKADFDALDASALAGDVAREDYIKRTEKIEYETGVLNDLVAFDACKDTWKCTAARKEWARPAKNFDEYYSKFLSDSHKENYGKWWDDNCKAAYDKKHPKK